MIYCANNTLKKLYDLISLKNSHTSEERNFIDSYTSFKENKSLLLLTKDVYDSVESQFKGNISDDSENVKSILQYAFINEFQNFSEVEMYMFSHIKSYAIANENKLNTNPFAPCYLNLDKVFQDLDLVNSSLKFKYEFLKNIFERISTFTLNITMLKSDNLALNTNEIYKAKLIDNMTIPTFEEFDHLMNTGANDQVFGFSFNVQLRDALLHSVYSLEHWQNHSFHVMSSNYS